MAVLLGAIKIPLTSKGKKIAWSRFIAPHLNQAEKKTDVIFKEFNKELKSLKITTIAEENKLWNKKYDKRFNAIDVAEGRIYKKLYNAYFNK